MFNQHVSTGMAPKKRANPGGSGPPAKLKRTSEDLERLGQAALQRNPHVKMLEQWLYLGSNNYCYRTWGIATVYLNQLQARLLLHRLTIEASQI